MNGEHKLNLKWDKKVNQSTNKNIVDYLKKKGCITEENKNIER